MQYHKKKKQCGSLAVEHHYTMCRLLTASSLLVKAGEYAVSIKRKTKTKQRGSLAVEHHYIMCRLLTVSSVPVKAGECAVS